MPVVISLVVLSVLAFFGRQIYVHFSNFGGNDEDVDPYYDVPWMNREGELISYPNAIIKEDYDGDEIVDW